MLKQGEVSKLIRKKCGIIPRKEEDYFSTVFSKEEQFIILAHIIKQDELVKESKLNKELIESVTNRVMSNLKKERDESES